MLACGLQKGQLDPNHIGGRGQYTKIKSSEAKGSRHDAEEDLEVGG